MHADAGGAELEDLSNDRRFVGRDLTLKLVGERRHAHEQLVGRRVEGALAIFEVQPHAHAGLRELLQRGRDLDPLAAEAELLGHDEDLERRSRFQRRHQSNEAWSRGKLGAGKGIVDEDALVGDAPALPRRVGACVLDLPRDGLRFAAETELVGGLPGILAERVLGQPKD